MALDFLAGCLGGCAGIMVGYPLDTIKVHIQTQDHRNPKYKGTWHCFRTLIARDSVAGLYRGMTLPMAGVAVVNAIVFGVYGQTQRLLNNDGGHGGGAPPKPDQSSLGGYFLAGASAGIAQAPVCTPIELAKTRLQLQAGGRAAATFRGPIQCLRQIHRARGTRGVFHGLGITLLREAPSFGVYFVTYEALTRSAEPVTTLRVLLAGGLAGTASWLVSYPLDVVKSRLQADTSKYSGALDCFRQSVRGEGYSCLFRGLSSTIVRAFPTNAATFAVVAWTLRLLGDGQGRRDRRAETRTEAAQEEDEEASGAGRPRESSRRDPTRRGLSESGEARGGYSSQRQLLTYAAVGRPTGKGAAAPRTAGASAGRQRHHFDESRYFDWTREVLHY